MNKKKLIQVCIYSAIGTSTTFGTWGYTWGKAIMHDENNASIQCMLWGVGVGTVIGILGTLMFYYYKEKYKHIADNRSTEFN